MLCVVQVFNHHYEDLYVFPWERKRPKAFMRASQQVRSQQGSHHYLINNHAIASMPSGPRPTRLQHRSAYSSSSCQPGTCQSSTCTDLWLCGLTE